MQLNVDAQVLRILAAASLEGDGWMTGQKIWRKMPRNLLGLRPNIWALYLSLERLEGEGSIEARWEGPQRPAPASSCLSDHREATPATLTTE